ncbi:hypothetical protein [Acetobacter oeni]|uniref:Uncharacterized protein n=1 Tax=Acetobacter oeni TaxID=304077 RepID=A0A511XNH5_9PROT|nr:hypothetical protein [Acetobacter oeni]MBB3884362.1 hypothetical protein [Acetobacter oeni]NHO20351.1 hypothetical protein [Acetobacter oeni]GBR08773.1 hypothetical protein AA21952_2703 [Acetobacter oeni LMG 21952]GEN64501.1 hypothetical protein AOE01nite_27250 [Acetobacter oeni]
MSAAVFSGQTAGSYLETCARCQTRSDVVMWLTENFETLLKATGRRALKWSTLAEHLARDGLRTQQGRAPTPNGLRVEWYRVKERITAAKAEADRRLRDGSASPAVVSTERAPTGPSDEEILALMAEADNEERLNRERRERIAGYEAQRRPKVAPDQASIQPTAPAEVVETAQSQPASLETATQPRVKIGQIANHVTMLTQAPRYGADRDKPLPPPYVGPRPDGMPEYLPLDALMPLDATGRQPDGRIDYEALPGLPRRSFFESEREWAKACIPMVEAVPHEDRSIVLKALLMRSRDRMKSLY